MLEQMLGIASRAGAMPLMTGPRDAALREARVCYDHLAGRHAVALLERLLVVGIVVRSGAALSLGPQAQAMLASMGVDFAALKRAKRVPCRACLDWSERRDHLAGALGAALLQLALDSDWIKRERDSRAVTFTPGGLAAWNAIGKPASIGELMRE